jgi:hypothetical protein
MEGRYSREAQQLMSWAVEENNRIKASHILKAAQSLELRYRENHRSIVDDLYTRPSVTLISPRTGSSVQR